MAAQPISRSRGVPSAGTARGGTRIVWVAALAAATALTYAGTLANGLVWDDVLHIVDNPRIRDWSATFAYFTHQEGLYYRPLIFLGYALEHALWGTSPAGFHLTNLALHLLATLLVRAVGIRIGLTEKGAWIAAAIFAVHPVQVDAVAYVSGRTDLLVAVGALSVWIAMWSEGDLRLRAAASALGTAVAVLGKESGFALIPFLLWGLLRRRKPPVVILPALAIAAVALALRPGLRTLAAAHAAATTSAVGVGRALATYVGLIAWPIDLQVDRLTLLPTSAPEIVLGAAALLACVALFLWAVTRRGPAADCAVWAAVFYLPAANVIVIYPVIAAWALFTPEHNVYAPFAGIALLAGLGFDALGRKIGAQRARVLDATVAVVLVACAALSGRRTQDWRDEESLFTSAVAAGSESPRVHFNLGNVLLAKGDTAGAATAYESALRRAPNDAGAWGNLAVARQRRREYAAAVTAYRHAIELRPDDARLHENLGSLYVAIGDLQSARDAFEGALRVDPARPTARRALTALRSDEIRRR